MICRRHQCVFVHVPKTAGQSIEAVFLAQRPRLLRRRRTLLLRRNRNPERGPPRLAHLTAAEYLDLGYLDRRTFDNCFVFAFVRNPWDRLVSEYRFRQPPHPFREWVLHHFPGPEDDDYRSGDDRYRHVRPQTDFITDADGHLLTDYVGRFENLEADFAKVRTRIALAGEGLPHVNRSAGPAAGNGAGGAAGAPSAAEASARYRDCYDADTLAFVADYYRRDIELFGYRF